MEKEIKKKWNWTNYIFGGLVVFWILDFIVGFFVPYNENVDWDLRSSLRMIIIIVWTVGYYCQLSNKNEKK